MGQTLIVSPVRKDELRFVLNDERQAAVMQAHTRLSDAVRENMKRSYEKYADCVKGFDTDESDFAYLGQAFFNITLPDLIRERIRQINEPLTIVTSDPTLPWEIMHDGQEFLSLRLPMARILVVQGQLRSLLRPVKSEPEDAEFSALIIADTTGDLPSAREEGLALADFFRGKGPCELLLGSEARFDSVIKRLVAKPYSVIHLCGHVDYDAEMRSSSIRLHDGHISAQDVVANFKGNPVVFLNACDSGRSLTHRVVSTEIENFAHAFMIGSENGVANCVVGTMWRVPDEPMEASKAFCLQFYEDLIEGEMVGEAMRRSRRLARRQRWGPMVWAPYILYSHPSARPFRAHVARTAHAPPVREQTRWGATADAGSEFVGTEAPRARRKPADAARESMGNPLDTSARQVFHVALREMLQMEQGAISSMHLLIGLCESGVEPLIQLIAEKEQNVADICEEARKRARALLPAQSEGLGISANAALVVNQAVRRAVLFGKDTVDTVDLLAGLLRCRGSEAVDVLASFQIGRRELLTRLPAGPGLSVDWFDAPTREAVQHAERCARRARLEFLGTPHLLVGLIRTGSFLTCRLLRQRNINLDELCEALLSGVGEGSPSFGPSSERDEEQLMLTPRSRAILDRARELASGLPDGKVEETQLLRALLEEDDGFTKNLLGKAGAPPQELLADLAKGSTESGS